MFGDGTRRRLHWDPVWPCQLSADGWLSCLSPCGAVMVTVPMGCGGDLKQAESWASPTRSDPLACCRLPSQAFLAPRPGVLAPGSAGGRQQQVAGSSAPLAGCQRLGSCARGLLLLAALEQRARRGLLSQELWSDGARDRSLQAINNPPRCHPASLQQGPGFCRAGEVVSWARSPGGLLAPTAWWPGAVRLWHLAPRAAPSPHPHVTGSWHMTAWAGTPRLFHGRRLAR